MSIEDDDLNFDDFEKKENTLADVWRDNPMAKVGIIVGIAVIIVLVIVFFGGEKTATQDSMVGSAPNISSAPGTDEASPEYIRAVEEINERAVEEAERQGTSALPVPIDPAVGQISVPEDEGEAEDPLQRWRRLQEERLEREIQQRQAAAAPVQDEAASAERAEAISSMSEHFLNQMSSVLDSQTTPRLSSRVLTNPQFLKNLHDTQQAEADALAEGALSDEMLDEMLLPAGEVVYAQTLTEANTDSPGPVLAEIMSGPLKGSRILGTFEEQEELLTLTFDTVVVNEESIAVDAVALDPNTTLPGMATEVDHRYFKRIALPAAAAFVEGFAGAIGERSEVVVVVEGGTVVDGQEEPDKTEEVALGIEEAGEKLSEIIDEMAEDTKVMVKIHAGTPIGILFLEPVVRMAEVEPAPEEPGIIPDIFLEEAPE